MSSILLAACLLLVGTACHAQAAPDAAPGAATSTAPAVPAHAVSATNAASAANPDPVDLDDIRRFTRVYDIIKHAYVDKVSNQRLMRAAIHGLLSQLDPHSEFMGPEQLQAMQANAARAYAGIGVRLANVDGKLQIIAPLDGTPAARAGLGSGDIIAGIDGKPVTSDNIDQLVNQLRGPVGSSVTLSILKADGTTPKKVTLVRERVRVSSARAKLLAPGYAWLRVSQFRAGTAAQLRASILQLQKEGPLAGAVLDLRSNPGGLLKAAVTVSDLFLAQGDIVSTRGRLAEAEMRFHATAGDILHGAPLVVLVDGGTASAAEIVAGALKDNQRGVVMGQRTFGKGSVQSILSLDAEHAVKLTTARYYTPNGTSIQAEGIQPDIPLQDLVVKQRDTAPSLQLSERELPHHLRNPDAPAPATSAVLQGIPLAQRDYALSSALQVLKGMVAERGTGAD